MNNKPEDITEQKNKYFLSRALRFGIIFIIVLGVLIALTNLNELKRHFLEINLKLFFTGEVCFLVVYFFEGLFLLFSLKLFKEKIKFFQALRSAFIINAIGYLVSFGGLTPFATQIQVLEGYGISPKKATLSRALHVVVFNIFFNFLLFYGYISVIKGKRGELNLSLITSIIFLFSGLLLLFYLAIFLKMFRVAGLKGITAFINRFFRFFKVKKRVTPDLAISFFNDFQQGCMDLFKKPGYFLILFGIAVLDWVFMLLGMFFSFLCLGYRINPGILVTGFIIGQIVVVVSLIPGGAGAMEGSMAFTYKTLGIPFETSLASVLVFRTLFYVIPFFLCLPLYPGIKRKILNIR